HQPTADVVGPEAEPAGRTDFGSDRVPVSAMDREAWRQSRRPPPPRGHVRSWIAWLDPRRPPVAGLPRRAVWDRDQSQFGHGDLGSDAAPARRASLKVLNSEFLPNS